MIIEIMKGSESKKIEINKIDYKTFTLLVNLCNLTKKNHTHLEQFKMIQNEIIKTNNSRYIYEFTRFVGGNRNELQEAFLKTTDKFYGYYCYSFAKFVIRANIEKLEDNLINKKYLFYPKYLCLFAQDIKKANIEKLYKAIKKTNNIKFINFYTNNILYKNKVIIKKKTRNRKNKKIIISDEEIGKSIRNSWKRIDPNRGYSYEI